MPYIHVTANIPITEEQEKALAAGAGKAVALLPGKSEQWLMAGCKGGEALYFQGKDEPAVFIEVRLFGSAPDSAYEALTGELTRLAEQTLFIPRNRIYVQYEECRHWGFAGSNF